MFIFFAEIIKTEVMKESTRSEDEELLSVLGEKEIKWDEGVGRMCDYDYQVSNQR